MIGRNPRKLSAIDMDSDNYTDVVVARRTVMCGGEEHVERREEADHRGQQPQRQPRCHLHPRNCDTWNCKLRSHIYLLCMQIMQ